MTMKYNTAEEEIAKLKKDIIELEDENRDLTDKIEDLKEEIYDLKDKANECTANYENCINIMDSFDELIRRVGIKPNNMDVVIFRKDLQDLLDVKR